MAMLWCNMTEDPYIDDNTSYGVFEEPFSLSTFNPAHLWFRTNPLQNPLQHPTRDPQSLPCMRFTYQYLDKKLQNGVSMISEKDTLFREEWECFYNAERVMPHRHSWVNSEVCGTTYVCGGNCCYFPQPLPPLAVAPLVHEGERPIGTKPVPPRRRRKAEKKREKNSKREQAYVSSRHQPVCLNCKDGFRGQDSHIFSRDRGTTSFNDYCFDGVSCQLCNNIYDCNGNWDHARMLEEYGGGDVAFADTGVKQRGGGIEVDGRDGSGGGGEAAAAAGVIGCVQVPSLGGTRGCLPGGGVGAPPLSPPRPPPRSRPPPPPPPRPPQPPHSSSYAPHRPRTLWRFLSCWMVKVKMMADWDVELTSPTYCAACAVLDTRKDECCSSTWETADAWWGSFVCPSWKCDDGGCVAEVIQETPKPSFTLPKPPVGPSPFGLPVFRKLEKSLNPPKWKTSTFLFNQDKPPFSVPKFKDFKKSVGFVPKWIHSTSSFKSIKLKWWKPKLSLCVPTTSLGFCRVRTRMKTPKRLSTCRMSTSKIRNLPSILTGLASKIQKPSNMTFRHPDQTFRRYCPYSRLKTRLKLIRAVVTDQIIR